MSTLAVSSITDASGGSTAQINGATPTVHNTMGRNRIINGDMRIDQRNAGASVTASNDLYCLDRWVLLKSGSGAYTVQQSSTVPDGFTKSLLVTVTSTDATPSGFYTVQQKIEGFNTADFAWGTASAKSVTLSFKIRSSVTGTFSVGVMNEAGNRAYVSQYTINSANTWETKSITIPGDTSGTWDTDNTIGLQLRFALGVNSTYSTSSANTWVASNPWNVTGSTNLMATNGATWYITGVQLEVGSVATEFERRPYQQELALAQRYYWKTGPGDSSVALGGTGAFANGTTMQACFQFPVNMRSNPTASQSGGSIADGTAASAITSISTSYYSPMAAQLTLVASGGSFTAKSGGYVIAGSTSAYVAFSAEL